MTTEGDAGVAVLPVPPERASGPEAMQRRLWLLLPLTGLSISMVWGGVLQALLAQQVNGFVADTGRQAAVLGAVLALGAVTSVVVNPVVGLLSDRTTARGLGRRNVWVLGGAVAGAGALLFTAIAPNVVVLALIWAVALVPLNGYQAAASAAFPERVPIGIRARLTALNGVTSLLGIGIGAVLGSLLGSDTAYRILAAQLVVVGLVFALGTKDVAPAAQDRSQDGRRTTVPGLRTAPDFWLVFAGRFLGFLAFGMIAGLQLYALRDHFRVGDGTLDDAKTFNGTVIIPVTALMLVVSAVVGGYLADRLRRFKPFVVGASLMYVPAAVVLVAVPSEAGAVAGMALIGLASGCYSSVDGALITLVLPTLNDAGRDLGILNIASAGPQVVAPVIAGGIVAASGYTWLYGAVMVVAVLRALSVLPVRSVR